MDDRTTGKLPTEESGQLPELEHLGDEDIIADGGTQIMSRQPPILPQLAGTSVSKLPPIRTPARAQGALAAPVERNADVGFRPAASSEISTAPPAPHTTPIQELAPDCMEEEQRRIERTQPFDRSRIFAAAPHLGDIALQSTQLAVAPSTSTELPVAQPLSAQLPASQATAASVRSGQTVPSVILSAPTPENRPTSFAPHAIDVPDSPLPPIHVPGLPRSNMPVIAGAIVGGLALCVVGAIALVSFSASNGSEADKAPVTVKSNETAEAPALVSEGPEAASQKAANPAETEDGEAAATPSAPVGHGMSGTPPSASSTSFVQTASPARGSTGSRGPKSLASTSPSAVPSAAPDSPPSAVPSAAPGSAPSLPAPTSSPPPRSVAPAPTTGAIDVPGSLMTIMVDGKYKRVQGGRVVVTCGKHRVNAGRGTQIVDVPCGGIVSLM